MPKQTKEQKVLYWWEYNVDAMGFFEMPEDYKANTELNKYDRFTGFMKEFVTRIIKGNAEFTIFNDLDIDRDAFSNDWWNTAIKVANGKEVNHPIPKFKNLSNANKDTVYGTFIPAYRVLKENFENRRWYEWIFNHSRYTAERDTLKALSGLMTSLLGVTQADIDSEVGIHKNKVPTSGISVEKRRETMDEVKGDRIFQIKLARARKWDAEEREKYGSREDSENEIESESEIESEILDEILVTKKVVTDKIFTNKVKNYLDNGNGFAKEIADDDGIDNIYNFESVDGNEKEQVIFDDNAFTGFDDSGDIQKPIDKEEKSFIEKNDEIIENMKMI